MDKTSQPRILIVDDEEVVRSLCARTLTPLGYRVETAVDGQSAMHLVETQPFDLMVTDYRMPGDLNGLELGRLVKKQCPQTEVILMTAFPEVNTAVEMLRTGARDYLIKPFVPAELVRAVQVCFEKRPA